MKIEQVAVQCYTIRELTQTPAGIAESMKKIREIGYQAVQISGMGPIPEEEMMKILDGEGLVCCATHEPGANILDTPELVVERLNKLNCKYTAYPFPHVNLDSLDAVEAFAAALNASGKVLRDAGKVLTYHNHQLEFKKMDGRIILDVIYNATDHRYLQGEPDTYWIQFGGGDPTVWCKKLNGRLPLLHMKDYTIAPDGSITMTEVGNGNLDWPRIVGAAEHSGCEWFIVEQDICPGDPFDSLKKSFEYIKNNLCE